MIKVIKVFVEQDDGAVYLRTDIKFFGMRIYRKHDYSIYNDQLFLESNEK